MMISARMAASPSAPGRIDALFATVDAQHEAARAQIAVLDLRLGALAVESEDSEAKLKAVSTRRADALLSFMRQHAEQEERATEVEHTRQRVARSWERIEELQARRREIEAEVARHAVADQRSLAERRARATAAARVEARMTCGARVLEAEVEALMQTLADADARRAAEEAAAAKDAARVAAAAAAAAAAARAEEEARAAPLAVGRPSGPHLGGARGRDRCPGGQRGARRPRNGRGGAERRGRRGGAGAPRGGLPGL